MKKLALILIYLLVVIFNSSSQIAFSNHPMGEIFRINHDSTEITFAGHKYIKQADIKIKQTGMIQTEYHSDGSIKSVSKDGISVFRKDVNGNIGIGNGGYDVSLHVYSGGGSVGLMPMGFSPSEKLIINPNSEIIETMAPEQFERHEKGLPKKTIIFEPGVEHKNGEPIGNSKPMKRLIIQQATDTLYFKITAK
jgi:hypothetical protein